MPAIHRLSVLRNVPLLDSYVLRRSKGTISDPTDVLDKSVLVKRKQGPRGPSFRLEICGDNLIPLLSNGGGEGLLTERTLSMTGDGRWVGSGFRALSRRPTSGISNYFTLLLRATS